MCFDCLYQLAGRIGQGGAHARLPVEQDRKTEGAHAKTRQRQL